MSIILKIFTYYKPMHICFIIDNGPLTQQAYNYSKATHNTITNITILDTIKIAVETTLNDLARSGAIVWELYTFHLFVTSHPYSPLSSFEHDRVHFHYQLKELRSSLLPTDPAETLRFAIKHISKFRSNSDVETFLGYRKASVFEPALIVFFSFGLTMRAIAKIEAKSVENLMRYEYKFIHYRLCYPSQSEKDKNSQRFKVEIENCIESKRLQSHAQKMNKGQFKNVIKYQSPQSLSDLFTKFFVNYKQSICAQFIFDSQIKVQFPEYFKNSDLNIQNFVVNEEGNKVKVELCKNNDKSYNNFEIILLPFEASNQFFYQAFSSQNRIREIQQIKGLQFFIDVRRKLTGSISNAVPFVSYTFLNMPLRLARLQKQLQRLGQVQVLFPMYFSMSNIQGQKVYYLSGFLHFYADPRVGSYFEIMVSFPNFPFIEWIINLITNQKTYADGRKIQKLLIDYHAAIPKFYHKQVRQYFKRTSTLIPALSVYQKIAASNWERPSNTSGLMGEIREFGQQARSVSQYLTMKKLKRDNENKHAQGIAECCPAFNSIEEFNKYSKSISKSLKKKSILQATLDDIFEQVNQFSLKNGFKSYFSGREKEKSGPMAKELSKYMQKSNLDMINVNSDTFSFSEANQSIHEVPIGLTPSKKLKPNPFDSQDGDMKPIFRLHQSFDTEMIELPSEDQGSKIDMDDLSMIANSVTVDSLTKNAVNMEETQQILKVERQLMLNKIEMEKNLIPKDESSQPQVPIQVPLMEEQSGLFEHLKKIPVESPFKLKINRKNLRPQKFDENIKKLTALGLIGKPQPQREMAQQQ